MNFSNKIIEELSDEGKHYLSSHLQGFLNALPKEDRAKTSVGVIVKITNPTIWLDSLTETLETERVKRRLNGKLYFCTTLYGDIVEEYELLPNHLTPSSFLLAEKLLREYNIFWNGESMFVVNE